MTRISTNHKKLILTLTILTIINTTIFLTKPAEANNKLATAGDIKIYNETGATELTTITFQLFIPGQQSTQKQAFTIRNTGSHPVQISWFITESSITWNKTTKPKTTGYSHSAEATEKYTLHIGQETEKKTKYLKPEKTSLTLTRVESANLFFELTYSGKPTTAEVFTLTITFAATITQG